MAWYMKGLEMKFQVSKQHPSRIYNNLYRVKIIQLPFVSVYVQAVRT